MIGSELNISSSHIAYVSLWGQQVVAVVNMISNHLHNCIHIHLLRNCTKSTVKSLIICYVSNKYCQLLQY